ncbi:MAG: Gfo/Idh/MocA family oxidoreductase [Hyphomicrobiales bacterium]|jgi:hypothetical protein
MIKIAIVGAGALGQRHLSALARLGQPVQVLVIDPSRSSLHAAEDVFNRVGFPQESELIISSKRLEACDVAIIATNARERLAVLEGVLASGAGAVLLEKVLFTRLGDYDRAASLIQEARTPVFVNCARRTFGSFSHLKMLVAGRPFSYRVEGNGWGLACNAVHHLDEFAALAGKSDIKVDASGLTPGYFPAKRPSYLELGGCLRASTPDGSSLEAICRPGPPSDRLVTVETLEGSAIVSEKASTLTLSFGGKYKVFPIDIPLQSRITAEHVCALLAKREPALPDYTAASAVHRPMICAFLEHLRLTCPNETFDECPIT